jgi:hydroxymethylpyrimidine/phosphomethylpyrimidine kinase
MPEAEALTGRPVVTVADLRAAAEALLAGGARSVVVKGGHLQGPAIDIFADGHEVHELRAERIPTRHSHGTGCTFAAAIAARLALGDDRLAAVIAAKRYVTAALAQAPGLGRGHGPLRHKVLPDPM